MRRMRVMGGRGRVFFVWAVVAVIAVAAVALASLLAVAAARARAVYADNNASTPMFPEAVQVMVDVSTRCFANPSSIHALGKHSRDELDACRKRFAAALGAWECELVFTGSATEANNLAIRGLYARARKHAEEDEEEGAGADERRYAHKPPRRPATAAFRVVTTNLEHASIYETLRSLVSDASANVQVAQVGADRHGVVSPAEVVKAMLAAPTDLVCLILANNEVGTIQDIAPVVAACRARGIHLHLDMTQVVGKYPVDLHAVGCDSATMSAHKFHGPKGVGALFVRSGVKIETCTTGGGQEMALRSGTENLAGIAAATVALERCVSELAAGAAGRVRALRDHVERALLSELGPGLVRINGHPTRRLYNTLSVCFGGGVNSREHLVPVLDAAHIYVNVGCACSKGKPSATLSAMGVSPAEQAGSVRVSFGLLNTEHDARAIAEALCAAVRAAVAP